MTWAKRTDGSHAEVRDTLRTLGYVVIDLCRVGGGVPDLLASNGVTTALVEVKAPKGKLSDDQVTFRRLWPGQYAVLRSASEVVSWHRREHAA